MPLMHSDGVSWGEKKIETIERQGVGVSTVPTWHLILACFLMALDDTH
jgi:hypothetical protein